MESILDHGRRDRPLPKPGSELEYRLRPTQATLEKWREVLFATADYMANLRDIIASKRARGRHKDLIELPLLESFRAEYEKHHNPPLRSAADIVGGQRGKA